MTAISFVEFLLISPFQMKYLMSSICVNFLSKRKTLLIPYMEMYRHSGKDPWESSANRWFSGTRYIVIFGHHDILSDNIYNGH